MKSLTAIILAGGFSSRMGSDKGLTEFSGQPMIKRTIGMVQQVTNSILIISNQDEYLHLKHPVHKDILIERGPLGGIHAGLMHSKTELNLVLACDMPLMTPRFLLYLTSLATNDSELVVPRFMNQLQPLCAIYPKSCIEQLKSAADSDDRSLHSFIRGGKTKFIEVNESTPYFSPHLFSNANNKTALNELETIYHES